MKDDESDKSIGEDGSSTSTSPFVHVSTSDCYAGVNVRSGGLLIH